MVVCLPDSFKSALMWYRLERKRGKKKKKKEKEKEKKEKIIKENPNLSGETYPQPRLLLPLYPCPTTTLRHGSRRRGSRRMSKPPFLLHPRTKLRRPPLSSSSNNILALIPYHLLPTTTSSHQPQPNPPIINLNILIQDPEPFIHHGRRQETRSEVPGEIFPEVGYDGRQRVAFRVEDADGAVVLRGPGVR